MPSLRPEAYQKAAPFGRDTWKVKSHGNLVHSHSGNKDARARDRNKVTQREFLGRAISNDLQKFLNEVMYLLGAVIFTNISPGEIVHQK